MRLFLKNGTREHLWNVFVREREISAYFFSDSQHFSITKLLKPECSNSHMY